MKLPQIRMQSTFIQLGFKTIDAKHQIEQTQADLSIRQPLGELTIKTKPGKLYMDAKQCREDIGLTTNKKMMEQNAQKGNAAVMEGIARRISEGNQMMKIENGGNAIQQIGKKYLSKPYRPVWMDFVPKYGSLKMRYEPAELNIHYEAKKAEIDVTPKKPIFTYTRGDVKGEIIRWNDLEISFVNLYA